MTNDKIYRDPTGHVLNAIVLIIYVIALSELTHGEQCFHNIVPEQTTSPKPLGGLLNNLHMSFLDTNRERKEVAARAVVLVNS